MNFEIKLLIVVILACFNFGCKKDCAEVIGNKDVKIIVLENISNEDLTANLDSTNFIIYQLDIPGQTPIFHMAYGTSPIKSIASTFDCQLITNEKFSLKYGVNYENNFIGKLEIEFDKLTNECGNCASEIKKIELLDLDAEVIMK